MVPFAPRLAEQVPISQNILHLMTPLKRRPIQADVQVIPFQQMDSEPGTPPDRSDLKERNRLAAAKWRKKKDQYLGELEEANDQLRKQALELLSQAQSLKIENQVLEAELTFFQQFMSKIMSGPKWNLLLNHVI